ncbi:basic helix-loop-helix (bHLH) DNA-binding superfamily protein [Euphorbia peplus]|nr:basic helix-loop-helix (bHLH) DNA-binding superfamily protein [Euphorbia peplus]
MAQECSESSVAISPVTPPGGVWWDLHYHHHASSLSSCWTSNDHNHNNTPWHHQPNPSSNSSCEEDVSMSASFTNASNHSGLTVDSARRLIEPSASSPNELMAEHASDTQLWSHILLGVGSNGEQENNQDVGENLLEALSSKSISSGIFEPACDYLKKLDSNWEFTNNPSSLNNFDKHMNGFSTSDHHHQHHHGLIENERMTKLSNLVSNWSIAPPDPGLVSNCEFDPITCNISLNSSLNHFSQPQNFSDSASCATGINRVSGFSHGLKVENVERQGGYGMRSFDGNLNGGGYNFGLKNSSSGLGDNGKGYYGVVPDDNNNNNTCTAARNFRDGINFNVRLNKPLIDVHGHKPSFKSLTLSDCRKQGLQSSLRPTGRGQSITGEGKKKRSDHDNSETTVLKKPKHETSTASSVKMQAPKVKLGDRITALQQIVSPFGKTDTASVLMEAIQYIKFLQEQVQLLSNPYMKNNAHKDPWGLGLEKKEKGDMKVDLKSRGLCLVPISCTPQVYHENTGSDYWTPTYRGCLYR